MYPFVTKVTTTENYRVLCLFPARLRKWIKFYKIFVSLYQYRFMPRWSETKPR
uniref:Uncharacterized protein n=1 Tax=Candidatus Kentrum eta TaxID=2126337 RepID=A0A450UWS3_9GAMM|nr:MAG: hypothetical protein BECKH772A_GA0070896_1008310 [Candidatus Kentron sp. H]VFJ96051.1 MAG: hypothetical protein BECKH772B_GA0070898_1008610 [Candidatus Kentron sp. H]VFJ96967.1 MAG: hypothetical protein BECKH772A_GA0070896_1011313 [Candidatus Kentron sp. H]VFK02133.1 MAG: hypothetical protein BECKH772C_GA0070978_1008210 [Candidatus Kentron sp. H]VFK03023.1 MAG: hypothetical protein BECKH772C_GA0070978_1011113 [Candidatus Kentron sp. H]